jgi:hypothetical protein
MEIVLVLAVVVAIVLVPVLLSRARETDRAWSAAARSLGLGFTPSGFFGPRRIDGRYKGFEVRIHTFTRRYGKSSKTFTRFQVRFPRPLGLGLALSREGFFAGVAKTFGAQDIVVGDPSFDAHVLVKGTNPVGVIRYLTPARRLRIRRFLLATPGASVDDRGVQWETGSIIRDQARLMTRLRGLTALAWHLSEDPPAKVRTPRAPDRASEKPAGRSRTERATPAPESAPPPPEPAPPPPESAPPPPEPAPAAEPDELPSAEEEEFVPVERPASEDAPAPAPEPAPLAPAPPPLDVPSVCAALFAPEVSSYQASAVFEQSYRGLTVRWTGVLREVETYSYDAVFGSESGTRAVLEVFETTSGLYGETAVLAIARLARDACESLRGRVGAELTVEGRLIKVDAVMRHLYLDDGRVTSPAP